MARRLRVKASNGLALAWIPHRDALSLPVWCDGHLVRPEIEAGKAVFEVCAGTDRAQERNGPHQLLMRRRKHTGGGVAGSQIFRFANETPPALPGFPRAIAEVAEVAGRKKLLLRWS
jgi:hypothetical protein